MNVGGYKTRKNDNMSKSETDATKVGEEEHLEVYGGLGEEIGIKTCPHDPMDYSESFVGGTWTRQREERGIPVVRWRRG